MEENETNGSGLVHIHVVAAFTSCCILLTAMLIG